MEGGRTEGREDPVSAARADRRSTYDTIYIVEGEGKADLLAKLGFTVTSASGGAGKWTADLNEWFKDRVVYILPDNDEPGRKHAQLVARNLDPVAKCVRIVELPDLPHKGDVKQWLEHDPSGARLIKECARAPIWEPAAEQPRSKEVDEALVSELAALSKLDYAKRRKGAAEEIGITVGELDKIVVEVRGEGKPDEDQEWAVDPWPDEVATADLLATLCETYKQHVILPEHGAEAMALWVAPRMDHGREHHQSVPVLHVADDAMWQEHGVDAAEADSSPSGARKQHLARRHLPLHRALSSHPDHR